VRHARAVLLGAIPPFLLQTPDKPDGVDRSVFDGIKAAMVADRPAYFKDFLDNFYNVDVLRPARISDQAWASSFNVAVAASAHAAWACVDTWLTDFPAVLCRVTGTPEPPERRLGESWDIRGELGGHGILDGLPSEVANPDGLAPSLMRSGSRGVQPTGFLIQIRFRDVSGSESRPL
jgi:hypothetical protein